MAKPKRLPKKVESWLFDIGFGRDDCNYYQAIARAAPLSISIHFGKEKVGLSVFLCVYYLVGAGGIMISPLEYIMLRPDGRLSPGANASDMAAFWDSKDTDDFIDKLGAIAIPWFDRLCDPKLMVELYDYLKGLTAAAPTPFLQLPDYINRKPTPNRLRGQAGYLNLLGRFEEALEALDQISSKLRGEADGKLRADAKKGKVQVPREALEYLNSIGAAQSGTK